MENSVAWLCGSIAEGLANAASDIDICVLSESERLQPSGPWQSVRVNFGSAVGDVAVIRRRDLDRAISELDNWVNGARAPRDAMRMSDRDIMLLHRIQRGIPLFAGPAFEELQRSFDSEWLRRVLVARARHMMAHFQLDIAGMERSDDWRSMIIPAQLVFDYAVDGHLASLGHTNPSLKWRVRLIEKVGLEPFTRGPSREGELKQAVDWYLSLRASPQAINRSEVMEYAHRLAHVSRILLAAAEHRLDNPVACEFPNAAARAALMQQPLPRLALETCVRYCGGKFELFSMLERDVVFALTPGMFACLPLFGAGMPPLLGECEAEAACAKDSEHRDLELMLELIRHGPFVHRAVACEASVAAVLMNHHG